MRAIFLASACVCICIFTAMPTRSSYKRLIRMHYCRSAWKDWVAPPNARYTPYTHAASQVRCAGSSVYVYCTQHRLNFKCSAATRKNEEKKAYCDSPRVWLMAFVLTHTQNKTSPVCIKIKICPDNSFKSIKIFVAFI